MPMGLIARLIATPVTFPNYNYTAVITYRDDWLQKFRKATSWLIKGERRKKCEELEREREREDINHLHLFLA